MTACRSLARRYSLRACQASTAKEDGHSRPVVQVEAHLIQLALAIHRLHNVRIPRATHGLLPCNVERMDHDLFQGDCGLVVDDDHHSSSKTEGYHHRCGHELLPVMLAPASGQTGLDGPVCGV